MLPFRARLAAVGALVDADDEPGMITWMGQDSKGQLLLGKNGYVCAWNVALAMAGVVIHNATGLDVSLHAKSPDES